MDPLGGTTRSKPSCLPLRNWPPRSSRSRGTATSASTRGMPRVTGRRSSLPEDTMTYRGSPRLGYCYVECTSLRGVPGEHLSDSSRVLVAWAIRRRLHYTGGARAHYRRSLPASKPCAGSTSSSSPRSAPSIFPPMVHTPVQPMTYLPPYGRFLTAPGAAQARSRTTQMGIIIQGTETCSNRATPPPTDRSQAERQLTKGVQRQRC